MAELINEFARQFARRYLMGAHNEQPRAALNAVKHRLIEEGHSLVALKALPEMFFQECGLPGFCHEYASGWDRGARDARANQQKDQSGIRGGD